MCFAYRTTVLIFNTCDGVADYMRVAARLGDERIFLRPIVPFRGGYHRDTPQNP